MPVATAGSAAALGADGKIYVVGGLSGGVPTNTVQVYDPAANSWTLSTPLPESLTGSTMGTDSLGRLVVMGGRDTNGNDVGESGEPAIRRARRAAGVHAASRHERHL